MNSRPVATLHQLPLLLVLFFVPTYAYTYTQPQRLKPDGFFDDSVLSLVYDPADGRLGFEGYAAAIFQVLSDDGRFRPLGVNQTYSFRTSMRHRRNVCL